MVLSHLFTFSFQGLTFSVHADSAWGGYLNCMTHGHDHDSASEVYSNKLEAQTYVPTIPLSPFVETQYKALKFADTGTFLLYIYKPVNVDDSFIDHGYFEI